MLCVMKQKDTLSFDLCIILIVYYCPLNFISHLSIYLEHNLLSYLYCLFDLQCLVQNIHSLDL